MAYIQDRFGEYGWPFPLDAGMKDPPPSGATGSKAKEVCSWEDVQEHLDKGGNWGLRIAEGIIVLDIDTRGHPERTLPAAQFLSTLPRTLKTGKRHKEAPIDGHYWFYYDASVDPENDSPLGTKRGEIYWGGVKIGDVLASWIRYAVMPGSRHGGLKYKIQEDAEVAHLPPHVNSHFMSTIAEQGFANLLASLEKFENECEKGEGNRDNQMVATAWCAGITLAELEVQSRIETSPSVIEACLSRGAELSREHLGKGRGKRFRELAMQSYDKHKAEWEETKFSSVFTDGGKWIEPVFERIQYEANIAKVNPWAILAGCATIMTAHLNNTLLPPLGQGGIRLPCTYTIIYGSSGAGKTVTKDIIERIVPPIPGQVEYKSQGSPQGICDFFSDIPEPPLGDDGEGKGVLDLRSEAEKDAYLQKRLVRNPHKRGLCLVIDEIQKFADSWGKGNNQDCSATLRETWSALEMKSDVLSKRMGQYERVPVKNFGFALLANGVPKYASQLLFKTDQGDAQRYFAIAAAPEPRDIGPEAEYVSVNHDATEWEGVVKYSKVMYRTPQHESFGEGDVNAHGTLVRLKLAVGLEALIGKKANRISKRVWAWSGILMKMRDEALAEARKYAQEQLRVTFARKVNEAVVISEHVDRRKKIYPGPEDFAEHIQRRIHKFGEAKKNHPISHYWTTYSNRKRAKFQKWCLDNKIGDWKEKRQEIYDNA